MNDTAFHENLSKLSASAREFVPFPRTPDKVKKQRSFVILFVHDCVIQENVSEENPKRVKKTKEQRACLRKRRPKKKKETDGIRDGDGDGDEEVHKRIGSSLPSYYSDTSSQETKTWFAEIKERRMVRL